MSKSSTIPTLEHLEDRLLMSHSSLLSAMASAAQAVTFEATGGAAVTNTIDQQSYDLYQFVAPANGRLTIDMAAVDGLIDPVLKVYSSRGGRLAANNNASAQTQNSRLTIRVKQDQTYYVMAGAYKNTRGAYQLNWTDNPTDDYGNTNAAAATISLGRAGSGVLAGRIDYGSDVDVFKFTADRDGQMTVNLVLAGVLNTLAANVAVSAESGALLASGQAGNTVLNVVQGQTYYVRLSSSAGTQGRYRLQVKVDQGASGGANATSNGLVPTDIPQAQPGDQVIAQAVTTANGLELLVAGTNRSDTITVAQTPTGMTVTTIYGMQSIDGIFAGLVIYGFDGNDTIRVTNTVTVGCYVDAGSGNDSVFNATSGQAMILGGAGDDLVVSVGAGQATLVGQGGLNSFWCDSRDSLPDDTAAELAAGAVHRIAQFYQPYTRNTSSPSYIPLTVAGQSLPDPRASGGTLGYHNFSKSPLFVNGPGYTDIQQGGVGDCYYLASLAALAQSDPQTIRQAIAPLGDGTFVVRFYRGGQSVYVRVDGDLPVSGSGSPLYAGGGSDGELWVPLMEKAYAFFRKGQSSYGSLDGGWMSDVFTDVANASSAAKDLTDDAASVTRFLLSDFQAGHALTLGSYDDASGPVVPSHAYMVQDVFSNDSGTFVTVYNPWGVDGTCTAYDSSPGDGLVTLSIAQVQQYFSDAVACNL